MTRIIFLLLMTFCSVSSLQLCAQSNSKQEKKSISKKQVNNQEEKIEEIREDRAISTGNIDKIEDVVYRPAAPVKNYDTTMAPNDLVTSELHGLIDEMGLVDIAIQAAQDMIAQSTSTATAPETIDYLDRFSASLTAPEVKAYYRNLFTKVYRKHFSIDEIKDLQQFYRTSTGKKTLRIMNGLMQETAAEASKFGEYWAEKILYDINQQK